MITLTAAVAANSTDITTKAATTALTVAEASIVAHTGEIGALQTSVNGLGNSFWLRNNQTSLMGL